MAEIALEIIARIRSPAAMRVRSAVPGPLGVRAGRRYVDCRHSLRWCFAGVALVRRAGFSTSQAPTYPARCGWWMETAWRSATGACGSRGSTRRNPAAQRCRRDAFEYGCGADLGVLSARPGRPGTGSIAKGEGIDRYGRDLGACVADGIDLNETMVRSGHAVAFGDYDLAPKEPPPPPPRAV